MIQLRPADPADASPVADIYLASRKAYVAFAPLAHSDEEVRGWIARVLIPAGGVYLAERDGVIVAMLALSHDGESGWIDHLYLRPGLTGQGIGAHCVDFAKAQLGAPIRLYTFQQNEGARRFYERHGFVPIEFGDGSGNEEGVPDMLYEWQKAHA